MHRNIPLCPISDHNSLAGSKLSSYEIKLNVTTKPVAKKCLVDSEAVVYEHMQKNGDIEISAPVGGYVQHSATAKSRARGGSHLRASLFEKSVERMVLRTTALPGAKSPLAGAVSREVTDDTLDTTAVSRGSASGTRPWSQQQFSKVSGEE